MMKPNTIFSSSGFTLIELLVATMIATLISGVLLMALSQGTRSQAKLDNAIDMSERIGIVANLLEKDLMGAFIPTSSSKASVETSGDAAVDEKEKKTANEKKDSSSAKTTEETAAGKQPSKPIEKIFYGTHKEGKFDTLTFVTNDPLTVFVGKDVGEVKPKVARVQYSLKPEAGKKNSYALFRQESKELNLEEYKNVRPYEVIGGIKDCTVKYTARIEKKQEKTTKEGEKEQKNKKKEYEYKELTEWVSEQKESSSAKATTDTTENKEKKEQEFPRIPYHVEFKITLWDQQDNKNKQFTIVCEIPVDFTVQPKQEKKQPQKVPKEEQKPAGNQSQQQKQSGQGKGQEVALVETLTITLSNLTKLLKQM